MFGTQHKEKPLMITHFFVFTFTVSFSPHCLFQSNKGVLKRRVSLFLDSEVRKERKGGRERVFQPPPGHFSLQGWEMRRTTVEHRLGM